MALSKKKTITIALALADDRLLSRAARERGVSRSEFIRQYVARALEQYRRRPKPTSAGIVRALTERGDERELFGGGDSSPSDSASRRLATRDVRHFAAVRLRDGNAF